MGVGVVAARYYRQQPHLGRRLHRHGCHHCWCLQLFENDHNQRTIQRRRSTMPVKLVVPHAAMVLRVIWLLGNFIFGRPSQDNNITFAVVA